MSSKRSDLETCMQTMMVVFHKSACKDGDDKMSTLSNHALKDLLSKELSSFVKEANDAEAVNRIMKKLDNEKDGEVNFQEFVSSICIQCNALLMAHIKQRK